MDRRGQTVEDSIRDATALKQRVSAPRLSSDSSRLSLFNVAHRRRAAFMQMAGRHKGKQWLRVNRGGEPSQHSAAQLVTGRARPGRPISMQIRRPRERTRPRRLTRRRRPTRRRHSAPDRPAAHPVSETESEAGQTRPNAVRVENDAAEWIQELGTSRPNCPLAHVPPAKVG